MLIGSDPHIDIQPRPGLPQHRAGPPSRAGPRRAQSKQEMRTDRKKCLIQLFYLLLKRYHWEKNVQPTNNKRMSLYQPQLSLTELYFSTNADIASIFLTHTNSSVDVRDSFHHNFLTVFFPVNLELIHDLWVPNIFIYNLKTFKVIDVLSKLAGLWINNKKEIYYRWTPLKRELF